MSELRSKIRSNCIDCGGPTTSGKASRCRKCYHINRSMTFDNMSIEEAISRSRQKYSEANKYQLIRANALRRMKSLGIERKCVKCGYSFHVEVAHIKGISEFAKIDKIGEVNGIGNLVYLCRNHHYELDKGHFTL